MQRAPKCPRRARLPTPEWALDENDDQALWKLMPVPCDLTDTWYLLGIRGVATTALHFMFTKLKGLIGGRTDVISDAPAVEPPAAAGARPTGTGACRGEVAKAVLAFCGHMSDRRAGLRDVGLGYIIMIGPAAAVEPVVAISWHPEQLW